MTYRTLIMAFVLASGIGGTALAQPVDITNVPFSADAIPLSTAKLGSFPYLGLPDGYRYINDPQPRDFDKFPFWTGKGFHPVEGQLFMAYIRADSAKTYSAYELKRNIEAELTSLGAIKISDMKIPNGVAHALPQPVAADKAVGLGDFYNDPVATYLIRQSGRQIWVHFTTNSSGASWAILETKDFVPTAKPLQ